MSKVQNSKNMDPEFNDKKLVKENLLSITTPVSRNKVELKPGRSLMDWIRLTHAQKDLAGTAGKMLVVTPEELKKHNGKNDAWICLNGKVYNITPYLEYHPGGESELIRGAGKDATDLFNQIHRWVNAESMLQKCFVGTMKSRMWLQSASLISPEKKPKQETIPTLPGPVVIQNQNSNSNVELSQDEKFIFVVITKIEEDMKKYHIIIDLVEQTLSVTLNFEKDIYELKIKLEESVSDDYVVDINNDEKTLKISLPKLVKETWTKLELIENKGLILLTGPKDIIYRPCTLVKKVPVNYNTFLLTFKLPSGCRMHVPAGYHVHIKMTVDEVEVSRSYTPILPSLFTSLEDPDICAGQYLHFIIKIYTNGTLTPILNALEIDNTVDISSYVGNFSLNKLTHCSSLVMLAAGTGFTPMVKLIHHFTQANLEKKILLLFFNKTQKDILWQDELENLAKINDRFSVSHILSEPESDWEGLSGMVSYELLQSLLSASTIDNKTFFCICGVQQFTEAVIKCLKELNYETESIHAFMG